MGYLYEFAGASAVAIAKEKGFFEEENLDAELFQFFNGHAAILSMISKEVDFTYIGHAAHSLIINGDVQILIPNGISKGEKIITGKWTGINSISDLKGKIVATHLGTSGEAMLNAVLKNNNIKLQDINLTNINITNLANALINRKVDAVSTWDPYAREITEKIPNDYNLLADITNYSDEITLTSSFVSTAEYINNYPDIVKRFSRAILKAMDYRKNNLYEAAELTAKLTGNDIKSVKNEIDTGIWFSSSDIKNACTSGEILKWYEVQQNIFLDSKIIKETTPVTNYIQLSMLTNIL
ncbi:ABC-type nitrate/sulfonate/bicarbonate transport system, periplasmic component [Brachyspira intermedia PWS/A]|uniref:ABC-type nitrate/sulfonate/bicarbonate transport system, periplasmic component n=1 Tax=Brachyspira intermedia (strain ATCC 51140 / PWS/A) TaxID=1045858 RepID=G0EM98_BRAIP|nr:ABC transporter substrate-binding protein [Brachyspira intermedia]AEM21667.1 ABC-type nitrate/sulfonate/bicarbonate transport system, periplasmic component [Brachyspira intermedia PWS/A]